MSRTSTVKARRMPVVVPVGTAVAIEAEIVEAAVDVEVGAGVADVTPAVAAGVTAAVAMADTAAVVVAGIKTHN